MIASKLTGCQLEIHVDSRLLGSTSVFSHARALVWKNTVLERTPPLMSSVLFEAFWDTAFDGDIF